MYKRSGIKKLGKKKSHRKAMINNLLRSLFTHGKVETTGQKAKVLKGAAESLIGKVRGAKDEYVLRNKLTITLGSQELGDVVKEYASGKGSVGIQKIRFRDGDNAQISKVTLMDLKGKAQKAVKKDDKKVEKKDDKKAEKKNVAQKAMDSVKKRTVAQGSQVRAKSRSGL